MIRIELSSVVINERSDEQVITLREVEGGRTLPIIIGMFEAFAIDRLVKERTPERPLTHDLMEAIVLALGARVARVVIDDLKEETFYAKVVLRLGEDERSVDARPSDAITLALKTGCPVFVAEKVLATAASVG